MYGFALDTGKYELRNEPHECLVGWFDVSADLITADRRRSGPGFAAIVCILNVIEILCDFSCFSLVLMF